MRKRPSIQIVPTLSTLIVFLKDSPAPGVKVALPIE
jgi:hypothetical protein